MVSFAYPLLNNCPTITLKAGRSSLLSPTVFGITPGEPFRITRCLGQLKGGGRSVYLMSHRTFWTEKHSAVSLLPSRIGPVPCYVFIFPHIHFLFRCNPNEVIISHNEWFVNPLCQYRRHLRTYTRLISMLGPEIRRQGSSCLRRFQITQGKQLERPSMLEVQTPISSAAETCGVEDN